MKKLIISLIFLIFNCSHAADNAQLVTLVGLANNSNYTVMLSNKLVPACKEVSLGTKTINLPYIPWASYHSDYVKDATFTPREALECKVGAYRICLWVDEQGFKYALKKNEQLSIDDCIVKIVRLLNLKKFYKLMIEEHNQAIIFKLIPIS